MGSSKLTDEELIELAKKELEEVQNDRLDVGYYQNWHIIKDGNYKIATVHLYEHYKNWSIDPVSISIFLDFLDLKTKSINFLSVDKNSCNINLYKIIGDYVKNQRKKQKEKRLGKVPGVKSET